jgi:hypothetical protein
MIDIIDFRTILGIKKKKPNKIFGAENGNWRRFRSKHVLEEGWSKIEVRTVGNRMKRESWSECGGENGESGSGWGLEMGPSDFFDE